MLLLWKTLDAMQENECRVLRRHLLPVDKVVVACWEVGCCWLPKLFLPIAHKIAQTDNLQIDRSVLMADTGKSRHMKRERQCNDKGGSTAGRQTDAGAR